MNIATSDIIAAVGVLIALISFIYSICTNRKINKLDRILKEKELDKHEQEAENIRKADIEVERIEGPRGKASSLRFYNKGLADAYNVKFEITSEPEKKITLIMDDNYLPYPKLISFQNFEVHYHNFSRLAHQTIVISWDDEFAKGRTKEMVIDM